MTNRTTLLMFALQGLTLTGLLVMGVFVYQSRPVGPAPQAGETAGAGVGALPGTQPPPRGVTPPVMASMPPKPEAAAADQTVRLDRLDEQMAKLARAVASLKGEATAAPASKDPAAPATGPALEDAPDWEQLRAQADLNARHLKESKTSEWGEAATGAITSAYADEVASAGIFSKYKGNLATDCRGSVCSLTWTPDSRLAAPLSDESAGIFLEEVQSGLIALAATAPNAGQVKVSIDPATNPPTIRVLVDNSGGDPMPSAVSRYFDSGKRGQH